MTSYNANERTQQLSSVLDANHPAGWHDIVLLLNQIKSGKKSSFAPNSEDLWNVFSQGTAFITFSYGIDGVSIEISKYAHILKNLFLPCGIPSIHLIGGKFHPQADAILSAEWRQFQVDGINGWDKWEGGKWFDTLFKTEMRPKSAESNLLAREIYQQALSIAKQLGKYFIDNQIYLVIPVNVASNPGNIALTLGLVLVTEILGIYVLNSNHDFYWEDGKPPAMRSPGENPGIRDHFFRNIDNKPFFSLFKALYPWNGARWLQMNINARQSRKLVDDFGFAKEKVYELSTCISDTFLEPYSRKDVLYSRLRMGHILSNGEATMHPVPIEEHLSRVDSWMKKQRPVILAPRPGLSIAPGSDNLIILLQPTRVVSRKRIEKNFGLIVALLSNSSLRAEFESNPNRQLILHITGPTPKEHQAVLEKILIAYKETINSFPETMADRIFLAFSVGSETHPSFSKKGFSPLTIETIYRIADAVVFPSETEGRGLPIIEASASGIPIICSQYIPKEVFGDVVGEGLSKDLQIRYILFPEGEFRKDFLSRVADLLINPGAKQNIVLHNKEVVRARYSSEALAAKFKRLLNLLYDLDQGV